MKHRQRKNLIWSGVFAVGFLIVSYCLSNLDIPISGEKALLNKYELVRNYFFPKNHAVGDSILLIDVSYDKTPAEVADEYGIPIGHLPITDREKLLILLQELKKRDDYKYILLDVFFGQKGRTSTDSALYSTICSMPRIAIPRHSDEPLADARLNGKAGFADYTTTFYEEGFVKYPYISDEGESLPLEMYRNMTGRSIEKHWFLYTDGWMPVRKSIVLTFEAFADSAYNEKGEKNWYYLGSDILGENESEGLLYAMPELTKDKYIAIGSFEGDDIHNTFLGPTCGTLINLNAYFSLLDRHHFLSVPFILIMFCTFYILTYLTLMKQDLWKLADDLTQKQSYKTRCALMALSALCSWIGYSAFLAILCLITYLCLGEVYEILVTSTLFYLFALAVKYYDRIKAKVQSWKRK